MLNLSSYKLGIKIYIYSVAGVSIFVCFLLLFQVAPNFSTLSSEYPEMEKAVSNFRATIIIAIVLQIISLFYFSTIFNRLKRERETILQIQNQCPDTDREIEGIKKKERKYQRLFYILIFLIQTLIVFGFVLTILIHTYNLYATF